MKVDVAGVVIDNISKPEVLETIDRIISSNRRVYFVTPYSEMIVFAMNDPRYRQILNGSEIALADGIGVIWAARYLSSDVSLLRSLFDILLDKASTRRVIREQITGSRLIYDIARLAEQKNYSISLVGGRDNVAAQSAYEFKKLYPNLNIKLALSGRSFDEKLIQEISGSNSDILFVAYSPPKQEIWLAENLEKLNVKLAIGLGGTFDYIAGKRPRAPQIAHQAGLEWLWRLVTQPWRIKRMWNAIPVFIWKIYKYKKTHVTRN